MTKTYIGNDLIFHLAGMLVRGDKMKMISMYCHGWQIFLMDNLKKELKLKSRSEVVRFLLEKYRKDNNPSLETESKEILIKAINKLHNKLQEVETEKNEIQKELLMYKGD